MVVVVLGGQRGGMGTGRKGVLGGVWTIIEGTNRNSCKVSTEDGVGFKGGVLRKREEGEDAVIEVVLFVDTLRVKANCKGLSEGEGDRAVGYHKVSARGWGRHGR